MNYSQLQGYLTENKSKKKGFCKNTVRNIEKPMKEKKVIAKHWYFSNSVLTYPCRIICERKHIVFLFTPL